MASQGSPGALSLVLTQGRGACGRSSCINMGAGEGLLRSHLESLLMTRIRAAFSSLGRWLSARRSDRAYEGKRVSQVALGRLNPRRPRLSALQLTLAFTFSSSSVRLPFAPGPSLLE